MNLNSITARLYNPSQPSSRLASSHFDEPAQHSLLREKTEVTPETALVDRILAGDTQAFTEIVRRWQGPLINMAWRYCRDRARAEEMAQEAFIRAWRGLRSWRRESSFSTWLFSVAANVYRNELKRIPSVHLSLDEAPEPSEPFVHDAVLADAARDETVRRAVLALPDKYREPTILFYFHEMDLAAAAATMGIPEGTMKARLSRARAILRKRFPQLAENWNDAGQGGTAHEA